MKCPKPAEIRLDATLIVGGPLLYLLFVYSTQGNVGSPIPLLLALTSAVAINGAICLCLVRFVSRCVPLVAAAAVVMTELAYLNATLYLINGQRTMEPIVLVVTVVLPIYTAPIVLGGTVGFVRLGLAFWESPNEGATAAPSA